MNVKHIVLIVVVALIVSFLYHSQATIEDPVYVMSSKPLKAFVLGGTGNLGKSILKALIDNPNFEKVTLISRRNLELPTPSENPGYSKVDQKIIDFEDTGKYSEEFKGYDVGFSSLGTSSVGLTDDQYYHITVDYAVTTAKLAKDGGCKHFHFVSGRQASKTARFFWARTKAQAEEEITQLGFDRLSIYRPGGIIKDKNEVKTTGETVLMYTTKFLNPCGLVSIESLQLGKVIVNNTFRVLDSNLEILEHADIQKLARGKE